MTLYKCVRGNGSKPLALQAMAVAANGSFKDELIKTAEVFEQFLTRRLAMEIFGERKTPSGGFGGNGYNDDDMEDVVMHSVRYDAHWLSCQPPKNLPQMTILGIFEDEGDLKLPIHLRSYKATEDFSPNATPPDSYEAPHFHWKRTKLYGLSEVQNDIPVNDKVNSIQMCWLDFRSVDSSQLLQNQESTWHFLSSILGTHHQASPWVQRSQIPSLSDCPSQDTDVVVLVLREPLEVLQNFRVSDACPSWFLHSVAYLDHLEAMDQPWDWSPRAAASLSHAPQAVLYTYKRLKPRERLTVDHPVEGDKLSATTGCLWGTVPPEEQIDEADLAKLNDPSTPSSDIELPKEPLYRMQCPPYLNLEAEYGKHIAEELFSEVALDTFRSEGLAIPQWTPWPETQHYSVGPNGETTWTVFPLCYCFPANDVSKRTWVEATRAFCPRTCQLLQDILGDTLRTALFSQLAPETTLEAHTGWADLANHVLRLHIPLVVPPCCGTWVDGCVESHEAGRPLLFDDSKIHRAFNYSDQPRIVLIVDLARPSHLPVGTAKGGHSAELDQFISQMSIPK